MNEDQQDKQNQEQLIKEALQAEMDQYPDPDYDRVWQRIENNVRLVEEREKAFRKKMSRRMVASFLMLVIGGSVLAYATLRGAPYMPGPLEEMAQSFLEAEEAPVADELPPEELRPEREVLEEEVPAPEEDVGIAIATAEEAEKQLTEISESYPGTLYVPAALPLGDLQQAEKEEENGSWIITLEFSSPEYELLFNQAEPGSPSEGEVLPLEVKDTSRYTREGVEYQSVRYRFEVVEIKWTIDKTAFRLKTNLAEDEALSVAQSLEEWN